MNLPLLNRLTLALAAGDSLGSTSEFVGQRDIPALYARLQPSGWPFRQVGGGAFRWLPGAPTDDTDMAMALVRSAIRHREFRGDDVADRFLAWLDTHPPDVGGTTRATLSDIRNGQPWHQGALPEFQRNPGNAANGSLMRNGVVPGIARDLPDALRISTLHGLITHYAPLPMLCCAAHSWLIWQLLQGDDPLATAWPQPFADAFTTWLAREPDPAIQHWRHHTRAHLDPALHTFLAAEFHPDRFNPFDISYAGRAGYCLLTLEIAVWAAAWARRNQPFPTPPGFPPTPFQRTGPWTLAWVALIGHDADTYGAAAGPLIAAATGNIPPELTQDLLIAPELAAPRCA